MKVTTPVELVKTEEVMDVCVDVSKDKLNPMFEAGGREYEDEFPNVTTRIEKKLEEYHQIACENGFKTMRVICEPTGGYQDKLLRAARRLGFLTCYVNAESVAKFRVVETNDNGKTDIKDPKIMRTLGKLGKTIKHRILPDDYLVLRKLGKMYDECEVARTRLRCKIDRIRLELFCDYSFKKDFMYLQSGRALAEKYGCNPYRIKKAGFKRFCTVMKKSSPRMRTDSLNRLWRDVGCSVRNAQPANYIASLEWHFGLLWADFKVVEQRKQTLEHKMIEILERLRQQDPNIPPPTKNIISAKNLARLLAETGPLWDFQNHAKLMRYAGLNIRERQSGRYYGQNKISKKGRPLLRKVLQQIVLPIVRKDKIYGPYYHNKRETTNMPGNKAMIVVVRHFLRKFFGWYQSGQEFNEVRFFTCKTQYLKNAA